jgi:dihydroneopterin aldolase
MGEILLENMRFYAYHGVYAEEQQIGNDFTVDLRIELSFGDSVLTDQLADTLNYEAVYLLVKEQMLIPSKLLEHVAERILNGLLIAFPSIQGVEIHLSKLHPPLGGEIGKVTVVLCKKRENNR